MWSCLAEGAEDDQYLSTAKGPRVLEFDCLPAGKFKDTSMDFR
jgi:hypothetical protein